MSHVRARSPRHPDPLPVFDPTHTDPFAYSDDDLNPWSDEAGLQEGAGRRVLIVDDDERLLDGLCRMLGRDFDVLGVGTPSEALDRLAAGERFAVVLSDQEMPEMDGATLLGRVQELAPYTTRMLFTGIYDVELASRALTEGRIFRFLLKPCSGEDVRAALEEGILRHRRKVTWRLAQERLRFCTDSMQSFTQVLEERLDQAQYSVIFALARLAEERDNCTGRHLERVSLFCKLLAEGLRDRGWYTDEITDLFVRDIERCAPLHDIGKVGIPDSVLLKPGKLTGEEWAIMRRHPEIGAETLDGILAAAPRSSFLVMGRDVALYHHENWDGSGYGAGLSGEDIPLSARILRAADVYDALTTWRPYKEPWSHERALQLVVSESGAQFDPRVVEVLVACEGEFDRLRHELSDEFAQS